MLGTLGVFELMGPQPLQAYYTPEGLTVMPLRSGIGSAGLGQSADDFLKSLVDLVGPMEEQKVFYEGLCEAILNAAHHACDPKYIQSNRPLWISGKWWAAGGYLPEARELLVLVYDQGTGIPTTLPASKIWHPVTQFFKGNSTHAEII